MDGSHATSNCQQVWLSLWELWVWPLPHLFGVWTGRGSNISTFSHGHKFVFHTSVIHDPQMQTTLGAFFLNLSQEFGAETVTISDGLWHCGPLIIYPHSSCIYLYMYTHIYAPIVSPSCPHHITITTPLVYHSHTPFVSPLYPSPIA